MAGLQGVLDAVLARDHGVARDDQEQLPADRSVSTDATTGSEPQAGHHAPSDLCHGCHGESLAAEVGYLTGTATVELEDPHNEGVSSNSGGGRGLLNNLVARSLLLRTICDVRRHEVSDVTVAGRAAIT
jgi:hypothetical protein